MGGGPIFVPVLIWIFGFAAQFAVPLSKVRFSHTETETRTASSSRVHVRLQIMIFGVALAAFLLNIWQPDPRSPGRFLIDFDVTLFFVPIALQGTIVGVLLNLMFPSWLIVFLLFAVMLTSIYRTTVNVRARPHRSALPLQ
jgi:uncharacterized membrane protein YfcA